MTLRGELFGQFVAQGHKTPVTTEAEIVAMIQMGAGAGQLTRTETDLLTAVFHFDELFCSDVMIPWTNVVSHLADRIRVVVDGPDSPDEPADVPG